MFQPLPLHGDIRPWRFRRVSTPPQRSEVGMNDAVATQSEALELQSRQSVLATAPRALRHERILEHSVQRTLEAMEHRVTACTNGPSFGLFHAEGAHPCQFHLKPRPCRLVCSVSATEYESSPLACCVVVCACFGILRPGLV
jgi:hypothetical protein